MASPHRKLFPKRPEENSTTSIIIISPPPSITPTTVETCINFFCDPLQNDTVEGFCPKVCLALCPSICIYSLPDPLSPPPQPNKSHNLSPLLISMLIILAFLFVIITFYIVYTKIYPYFNNNTFQTRPRSWRGSDDNNTLDEEQNGMAVLFHPIWYIPTVGLNPSVINSITVQTYQRSSKGGVHVDGSDCAVCLAEFQDGDNLRVLHKCNHAFHLPCIDTWLRSHTNCPLCRAPVVVPDSDNQTVVNSSTPPLGGVDVSTVDHDDHDRDDDQRIIVLRRSSSFDGNIEYNKKEITMNSGGNKETGSSSSRHERGPVGLVGRSFSCTAKIFSSRYNNNNNNNNNDQ